MLAPPTSTTLRSEISFRISVGPPEIGCDSSSIDGVGLLSEIASGAVDWHAESMSKARISIAKVWYEFESGLFFIDELNEGIYKNKDKLPYGVIAKQIEKCPGDSSTVLVKDKKLFCIFL